MEISLRR